MQAPGRRYGKFLEQYRLNDFVERRVMLDEPAAGARLEARKFLEQCSLNEPNGLAKTEKKGTMQNRMTTTEKPEEHKIETEREDKLQRAVNDHKENIRGKKTEGEWSREMSTTNILKRKERDGMQRESEINRDDRGNRPDRKIHRHCSPEYTNDDDAFETEADNYTSNARQGTNNPKQEKDSDIHLTLSDEVSWLNEDEEHNPWLSLLPSKERQQAKDIRRETRRELAKKIRRKELRGQRKLKNEITRAYPLHLRRPAHTKKGTQC